MQFILQKKFFLYLYFYNFLTYFLSIPLLPDFNPIEVASSSPIKFSKLKLLFHREI